MLFKRGERWWALKFLKRFKEPIGALFIALLFKFEIKSSFRESLEDALILLELRHFWHIIITSDQDPTSVDNFSKKVDFSWTGWRKLFLFTGTKVESNNINHTNKFDFSFINKEKIQIIVVY